MIKHKIPFVLCDRLNIMKIRIIQTMKKNAEIWNGKKLINETQFDFVFILLNDSNNNFLFKFSFFFISMSYTIMQNAQEKLMGEVEMNCL